MVHDKPPQRVPTKHLRKLTPMETEEKIRYRFSHVGLSDLYDNVKHLNTLNKVDEQEEDGDIEAQNLNLDQNVTNYVSKSSFDRLKDTHKSEISRLETDFKSKNDEHDREMTLLTQQMKTLLTKKDE